MPQKGRLRCRRSARRPNSSSPAGTRGSGTSSRLSSVSFPHAPEARAESPGRGRQPPAGREAGGAGEAAGEAESPRGPGRERAGEAGPCTAGRGSPRHAHTVKAGQGEGRGLIRILFAMQQLGGGLFLADHAQ